jgi:hypothetical protein
MPSASAAARARGRSREAIATIRQCWLCCIAGMTFWIPILAVLITPKRTGFMAGLLPLVATVDRYTSLPPVGTGMRCLQIERRRRQWLRDCDNLSLKAPGMRT